MTFECDVFISYAHIDNLSLKEGEPGWVTNFHKALEIRLAQLLGERPSIWRDQKLQGNDLFGDEIIEQFPKTALMISILSPRYIKSEWCTREVREFTHVAEKSLGTKIGNKSRIFKVIKTQIPLEAQPSEIADTLGYEFYVADPNSGRIKELDPKIGGDLEQFYWAKLDDIAHDICRLLENLRNTGETGVMIHEEQLTVYLAETGSDLKEQREAVKRELVEYGYRVVPDTRLPYVDAEFKEAVENFLEQSVLSVHLVGSSYGMVPEGSHTSIIDLQNQLAGQKSKVYNLPRMIWVLPSTAPEDERQQQFILKIRADDDAQYGAEVFETTIEDFKSAVEERLNRIKKNDTAEKVILSGPEPGCVFLAETTYDLRDCRENIKRKLTALGYNILPAQPLPLVYDEFVETVDNLLEQCEISIHLLGEGYGVVPDKTKKSVVNLQYERSAEKSRKTQLKRLVRISPTYDESDERQCTFIDSVHLHKTQTPHPNDDIFEAPVDRLQTMIFEKLKQIEEEKRRAAESPKVQGTVEPGEDGPPLVYLICDSMDVDNIVELEDFLYERGCDVMIPAFEGNEEELSADHRENLKSCDAVIVYYGEGNELWMRSMTRDLTKIAGYGRTQPLDVKAVLLAAPKTRAKERFRAHGTIIIDNLEGFNSAELESFLEKLEIRCKPME